MNLNILYRVIFLSVHLRACLPLFSMFHTHSSQFIDFFHLIFIAYHSSYSILTKGPFLCERDLSCIHRVWVSRHYLRTEACFFSFIFVRSIAVL